MYFSEKQIKEILNSKHLREFALPLNNSIIKKLKEYGYTKEHKVKEQRK